MNRRTAMQVMASALLAPLVKLNMTRERDLSALVMEFTDPESFRYDLSSPWEFEASSLATDGRALICVPGLDYVHTGEAGRRPNAKGVFEKFWQPARSAGAMASARHARVAAR